VFIVSAASTVIVLQRLHASCLFKSSKYRLAMDRQPYAFSNSFVWQAPVKWPPLPARSEICLPHTHTHMWRDHPTTLCITQHPCYLLYPAPRSAWVCVSLGMYISCHQNAVTYSVSVGCQNRINPAQSRVISVAKRVISTTFPYVWVHQTIAFQLFRLQFIA
jgi:hypothetical protein